MENTSNFKEFLQPYLKRWKWFLISLPLCFLLAFLYLKKSTPVYNVKTTVLIKDAKSGSSSIESGLLQSLGGLGGMNNNTVENEIEVLKSKKIMTSVVEKNGLQTKIISKGALRSKELYKASSPVLVNVVNEKKGEKFPKKPLDLNLQPQYVIISSPELKNDIKANYNTLISLPYANIFIRKNPNFEPPKREEDELGDIQLFISRFEGAVSAYQKMLDVKLVNKDATVLSLSMNYPQTGKASDILNSLVQEYNQDAIADKNLDSKKSMDFIEERINIISSDLGDVETNLKDFKTQNNISDLGTETKLNLQVASEAKVKELEIDTQLELTNALISFVNRQGSYQVIPTNVGLGNSEATQSILTYNNLVLERDELLKNATASNPIVKDISAKIDGMRRSIMQSLQKNKTYLDISKGNLQLEQNKAQASVARVPRIEQLFRGIERQLHIKENLYLLLLQKREETAIALALTAPKARVLDKAYSSDEPVAPRKNIIFALSFLMGLGIPFGLIYLKEMFDNKIHSKHDIEVNSSIPVIAEIPKIGRNENDLVEKNDMSPMAEAFRILITNMNYMLPKNNRGKIVFVTSSVKGEGKTFISINLSLTLASATRKVVIIGSDVRNPQLQRYDESKKNAVGLSEYLYESDMPVSQIINTSKVNPYCDIIYSGSIPPNPTELLTNGRYAVLLEELSMRYDYVIVDTAPLMLVTDTFLISDLADATLYVTRSEYTEKDFLDFINNAKEDSKIHNVGLIINDVSKSNFGYGNKYGYGYNNSQKSFFERLKSRL